MIRVPDLVRQRAEANGAEGRRWLASLPDVVAAVAERWSLEVGDVLAGGSASLVVAATRDGAPCVLKVPMPLAEDPDELRRSILVHRLAGGRGLVRLLDVDEAAPALLLERLGPNLLDAGLDVDAVVDAVAATLTTFWRPAGDDVELPTGAEKCCWLVDYVEATWASTGRPCDRRVVDRAVAECEALAALYDPAAAVLVHGDAHGWNTLRTLDGTTTKLVDPEGLRSSREHDLAVVMREHNEPLLAGDTRRLVRARAERVAELTGTDADLVERWGFVERVSTGLANVAHFGSRVFLEVAERCA